MIRWLSLYLCVALLGLLPAGAMGVTEQLYQARVEVADQDERARAEGMVRAMRMVLLKVSGSERFMTDPAMQQALQQATRYAQRYQYHSEMLPQDEAERSPSSRLLLEVEFEPQRINALLREHGYAVWGRVRPETLIWMGVEDRGNRVLVGADDRGLVRRVLDETARERGLPVQLPLLDLADQTQVQSADLWGGFYADIEQASARYHAQAILIGRLYPVSQQLWEARWILLQDGDRHQWQLRSDDVAVLIANGVKETTEWLASRFAKLASEGEGTLQLMVNGVADLRAYRRLMDYLTGISGVQAVQPKILQDDIVVLQLAVEGGREALMRTIALDHLLELDTQSETYDIHYRLRP